MMTLTKCTLANSFLCLQFRLDLRRMVGWVLRRRKLREAGRCRTRRPGEFLPEGVSLRRTSTKHLFIIICLKHFSISWCFNCSIFKIFNISNFQISDFSLFCFCCLDFSIFRFFVLSFLDFSKLIFQFHISYFDCSVFDLTVFFRF